MKLNAICRITALLLLVVVLVGMTGCEIGRETLIDAQGRKSSRTGVSFLPGTTVVTYGWNYWSRPIYLEAIPDYNATGSFHGGGWVNSGGPIVRYSDQNNVHVYPNSYPAVVNASH